MLHAFINISNKIQKQERFRSADDGLPMRMHLSADLDSADAFNERVSYRLPVEIAWPALGFGSWGESLASCHHKSQRTNIVT